MGKSVKYMPNVVSVRKLMNGYELVCAVEEGELVWELVHESRDPVRTTSSHALALILNEKGSR